MLREAVADREEDMSTTEVDRDMVVEDFLFCHKGQIQAAVISRDDLIRNKLATGREQDMLDAKKLRAAAKK